jgi:glycosyltransferase involved in cell wall biosynthesis
MRPEGLQKSAVSPGVSGEDCGSGPPLVSVVISFLNSAKFLAEAIESVFAQTYGRWELLLVDDGSTDGSTAIALDYQKRCPDRVRYFDHPNHVNRGVGVSRNLGIRAARGNDIAFLDSDDVWLRQKLSEQVALLDAYPSAGMVCGASEYWYSWTGDHADTKRDHVNQLGHLRDELVAPPQLLPLALMGRVTTPCPSNIIARRATIEAVGGFEENFLGIYQLYEDQAFFAKIQLNASVYISSRCWDKYRKHEDSCVSRVKRLGKTHVSHQYYLAWLKDYLKRHDVSSPEVWRALRQQQRPYRYPTWNRIVNKTARLARRLGLQQRRQPH